MSRFNYIDKLIVQRLINGCLIAEIANDIKKSKRYIQYRLSDLKTAFNCKTTAQLVYTLTQNGVIK